MRASSRVCNLYCVEPNLLYDFRHFQFISFSRFDDIKKKLFYEKINTLYLRNKSLTYPDYFDVYYLSSIFVRLYL